MLQHFSLGYYDMKIVAPRNRGRGTGLEQKRNLKHVEPGDVNGTSDGDDNR